MSDKSTPDDRLPSPEEALETLLPPGDVPVDMAISLGLDLPADADAANEIVIRELAEARREAGELLEDLQRVAADFANYRKRTERDHLENVLRASSRVIESLLPALDSLDAAMAYEAQTDGEQQLLAGMQSTRAQMLDILAKEGFAAIDSVPGTAFDPAVHEAVAGGGEGHLVVSQEMRRGYLIRDRVIRPALVMVAPDGYHA